MSRSRLDDEATALARDPLVLGAAGFRRRGVISPGSRRSQARGSWEIFRPSRGPGPGSRAPRRRPPGERPGGAVVLPAPAPPPLDARTCRLGGIVRSVEAELSPGRAVAPGESDDDPVTATDGGRLESQLDQGQAPQTRAWATP